MQAGGARARALSGSSEETRGSASGCVGKGQPQVERPPTCLCWPGWSSQVALWVGLGQVRRPLPDSTRLLPPLSHIHHLEKVWPGLLVPRDCPRDCSGSSCPRQPGLGQDRPWGNRPLWVWSACGENKDQETASENTGWGGECGHCGAVWGLSHKPSLKGSPAGRELRVFTPPSDCLGSNPVIGL